MTRKELKKIIVEILEESMLSESSSKEEIDLTVEVNGEDVDITVNFDFARGSAGNRRGNIDTWEPAEGPEIHITKVTPSVPRSMYPKIEERIIKMIQNGYLDD